MTTSYSFARDESAVKADLVLQFSLAVDRLFAMVGEGASPRALEQAVWQALLLVGRALLACPVCGGRMKLRALVLTHETSAKLLGVLGLPWRPEQLAYRPAAHRLEEDWDGW